MKEFSFLDVFKQGLDAEASLQQSGHSGSANYSAVCSAQDAFVDDEQIPLVARLREKRFRKGSTPSSNTSDTKSGRCANGLPVRAVDKHKDALTLPSAVPKKTNKKKSADDKLRGWFDMPKQEHTPQIIDEIMATRLARYADPKRFRSGNLDDIKLPSHFHMAREVGGMQPLHANNPSSASTTEKRHRGRTMLRSLLRDETRVGWIESKYDQIQAEKAPAFNKKLFTKRRKQQRTPQ